MDHSVCAADRCASDADCNNGGICVKPGLIGNAVAFCMRAYCHTDADCSAHPGGICAPIKLPCCNGYAGMFCVYPTEKGCRTSSDCNNGYCAPDHKTGTAVCKPGTPICPA